MRPHWVCINMEVTNLTLLLAVLFTFLTSILVHLILIRGVIRYSNDHFHHLDANLAASLKNIVEKLPELIQDMPPIDPPNPMQQFFMNMIAERMNPAIQVKKIVEKGEDGKFIKK